MRWLAVAAALLPAAVVLGGCGSPAPAHGHQARPATTAPASVITPAAAQQVLSRYVALNNAANKARQASLLSVFEGGSSYRLDAGGYKYFAVADPTTSYYDPFTYVNPKFYVPRQTGYPAWFAVRAQIRQTPGPKKSKPAPAAYNYVIFTRASASASWIDVLEPSELSGAPVPDVRTDASGYATAIDPSEAGQLPVAPAKLPSKDITYLNGGSAAALAKGRPGLVKTGKILAFTDGKQGLGDLHDQRFFLKRLRPQGGSVIDVHYASPDQVFALRTAGGGALVFYDLNATMSLGAPFGDSFTVKYSGFLSGRQSATSFDVNYNEQFAVYEPPGASAKPRVVAQFSGPVSAECDGAKCKK